MTEEEIKLGIQYELYPPNYVGGQQVGIATGVKGSFDDLIAICSSHRSQFRNRQIVENMILSAVTHPKY